MAGNDLITGKQVGMIRRTATERWEALVSEGWITVTGSSPAEISSAIADWMEQADVEGFDRKSASSAIERLLALPKSNAAPKPGPPPDWPGPDDRDRIISNRFRTRCANCGQYVEEGDGYSGVKGNPDGGKPNWLTYHRSGDPACVAPESTGLDLTALEPFLVGTGHNGNKAARFAHPGHLDLTEDEVSRCKVRVTLSSQGWFTVRDCAVYTAADTRYGNQRPGGEYIGTNSDLLRAILDDPVAALRAYGQITSSCGVCGRTLESDGAAYSDDWNSVEEGIGPICAMRLGLR